jgi:hypothetical protein
VVALIGLGVSLSGTAYAATGGNFLLGKANTANKVSTLTNTAGAAMKLTSGGTGTPLTLNAPSGLPPMTVNSATKVSHLNADLLDGLNASDLATSNLGTAQTDGPLPTVLDRTFQMTGNTSLLTLEGSAYRSSSDGPGYVQLQVFACAGSVTTCNGSTPGVDVIGGTATFSNEVNSHKEMSMAIPFSVPAGTYTIGLAPFGTTTTDSSDFYQVYVVSLG